MRSIFLMGRTAGAGLFDQEPLHMSHLDETIPASVVGVNENEQPASDVASIKTKLAYSSGAVPEVLLINTVKTLANPVMNIQLGISPGIVGMALSIPRLWDAFTDPLMGALSDRTQSRWGRRKPYILIGSITSALSLVGMWMVPEGLGQTGLIAWFIGMMFIFYTCYGLFFVPWIALGYEISGDINDRTKLMSVRTFFTNVGGFIPPWVLFFTQLPMFESTLHGARVVCAVIGCVVIAMGLLVVLFTKERPQFAHVSARKVKAPFWGSMRAALSNKPFMRLVSIEVLMLFSISIDYTIGLYLNIYYVNGGDISQGAIWYGWGGTSYNIIALLTVFIVPSIALRFTKSRALALLFIFALIGSLSRWFTYTADAPWMVIIPPIFTACSFTAMWILVNSMIADICDVDEAQSGFRREGIFGSVNSWIFKTGLSIAVIIGGFTLSWCGFDESLGADQSPQALFLMKLVFTFVPAAAILTAIYLAATYPLKDRDIIEAKMKLKTM